MPDGRTGTRRHRVLFTAAATLPLENWKRFVITTRPRSAPLHLRSAPGAYGFAFQVRSNSALVTTLTLENAMAAPASIGLSRPKAASGMPIRL